jgi:hypothetical protein
MRKVLLGIAAAATVFIGSVEMADAQQRQRYNGGGYGYRGGNTYVQNNVYGGRRGGWNNGNAWAAGAIGLGVGALLGAAIAQPAYGAPAYGYGGPAPIYVPTCTPVLAGYGWNGYQQYPIYRQVCN